MSHWIIPWIKENQGKYYCKCGCNEDILSWHNVNKILDFSRSDVMHLHSGIHSWWNTKKFPKYIRGHIYTEYKKGWLKKTPSLINECKICGRKINRKDQRGYRFCHNHFLGIRELARYLKSWKKAQELPVSIINATAVLVKTKEVFNESRKNHKRNEVNSMSRSG